MKRSTDKFKLILREFKDKGISEFEIVDTPSDSLTMKQLQNYCANTKGDVNACIIVRYEGKFALVRNG